MEAVTANYVGDVMYCPKYSPALTEVSQPKLSKHSRMTRHVTFTAPMTSVITTVGTETVITFSVDPKVAPVFYGARVSLVDSSFSDVAATSLALLYNGHPISVLPSCIPFPTLFTGDLDLTTLFFRQRSFLLSRLFSFRFTFKNNVPAFKLCHASAVVPHEDVLNRLETCFYELPFTRYQSLTCTEPWTPLDSRIPFTDMWVMGPSPFTASISIVGKDGTTPVFDIPLIETEGNNLLRHNGVDPMLGDANGWFFPNEQWGVRYTPIHTSDSETGIGACIWAEQNLLQVGPNFPRFQITLRASEVLSTHPGESVDPETGSRVYEECTNRGVVFPPDETLKRTLSPHAGPSLPFYRRELVVNNGRFYELLKLIDEKCEMYEGSWSQRTFTVGGIRYVFTLRDFQPDEKSGESYKPSQQFFDAVIQYLVALL